MRLQMRTQRKSQFLRLAKQCKCILIIKIILFRTSMNNEIAKKILVVVLNTHSIAVSKQIYSLNIFSYKDSILFVCVEVYLKVD